MRISIGCPNCAAKLRATESMAGRKVKCPKCGAAIVLPTDLHQVVEPARSTPLPPAWTTGAVPPARPAPLTQEQAFASQFHIETEGQLAAGRAAPATLRQRQRTSYVESNLLPGEEVVYWGDLIGSFSCQVQ
jgi:predicted Zn finger-like uncharacterized protein